MLFQLSDPDLQNSINVVAQKRPGRPKKTWDEVLVDDRKKLRMDSADPQNRLVRQAKPSLGKQAMMMFREPRNLNVLLRSLLF